MFPNFSVKKHNEKEPKLKKNSAYGKETMTQRVLKNHKAGLCSKQAIGNVYLTGCQNCKHPVPVLCFLLSPFVKVSACFGSPVVAPTFHTDYVCIS